MDGVADGLNGLIPAGGGRRTGPAPFFHSIGFGLAMSNGTGRERRPFVRVAPLGLALAVFFVVPLGVLVVVSFFKSDMIFGMRPALTPGELYRAVHHYEHALALSQHP